MAAERRRVRPGNRNPDRPLGRLPDREREPVCIGRTEELELPRARIVVQLGGERNRRGRGGRELEREGAQRQGEAHAAGLDVRLLQRPVVEERPVPVGLRDAGQRAGLGLGEIALGDVQAGRPAADVLDVDADIARQRHRAGNQSVGMRQVEAQREGHRRGRHFGPAPLVLLERPRRRVDARVVRQGRAHQGVCEQELAPVPLEDEPVPPGPLVRRQQGVAGGADVLRDRRVLAEAPYVDFVARDRGGRGDSGVRHARGTGYMMPARVGGRRGMAGEVNCHVPAAVRGSTVAILDDD